MYTFDVAVAAAIVVESSELVPDCAGGTLQIGGGVNVASTLSMRGGSYGVDSGERFIVDKCLVERSMTIVSCRQTVEAGRWKERKDGTWRCSGVVRTARDTAGGQRTLQKVRRAFSRCNILAVNCIDSDNVSISDSSASSSLPPHPQRL